MSRWFRFYDDAINDPKVLRLSDAEFRAWVTLLCLCSKNQGTLPSVGDVALVLRIKAEKVAQWLTLLTAAKLVDHEDGEFSMHNWDTRQYKSDSSAERTREYRNRHRNSIRDIPCDVTSDASCDVTVTVQNRTEAETDKKDIRAVAKTTRPNADFEEFWEARPRRLGADPKEPARKLYEAAAKTIPPAELLSALRRYRAAESERANTPYLPQMVKWLRDKRWCDYPEITLVVSETNWRPILDSYKRFKHWPKGHGNEPGMPSCRAPPELLKEFGFNNGAGNVEA